MKSLPLSAVKRTARLCVVLFKLGLLGGCGACDDDPLSDISCRPGDPAHGYFDPALTELCSNYIDDNCNGSVNEGCDCIDGEMRVCGNQATAGLGPCRTGIETCAEGRWGSECVGLVEPQEELCDGIDNDCDGAVDAADADLMPQECPWGGRADAVFGGASTCQRGIKYCENGIWSECRGEVLPAEQEVCDDRDDDCDGEGDNNAIGEKDALTGERISCGPSDEIGLCQRGISVCHGGELLCLDDLEREGLQPVWPKDEICNNKDDDCDGQKDEGIPNRICGNAACPGFERCRDGQWVECSAPTPEPAEICDDGIDNNCDGVVDEDCSCREWGVRDCYDNVLNSPPPGNCGQGEQTCLNGDWGPCEFVRTIPEQCNGGHDDDCNPATSEETAQPRVCGLDVGRCVSGMQFCQPAGNWGSCEGGVGPEQEVCNNEDDDCDGQIDEGILRRQAVALRFIVDCSASMCSFTMAWQLTLFTYVSQFAGTPHLLDLQAVPGIMAMGQTMVSLTNGFVSPSDFQAALMNLGCNCSGSEPNLDAINASVSPSAASDWPTTGYFPYVIWIGDEGNASWVGLTEADVAQNTTVCRLPGCQPPECQLPTCQPGPPEVFVIAKSIYEPTYQAILNNTVNVRNRFFAIEPVDPQVYEQHLDNIFQDVCLMP